MNKGIRERIAAAKTTTEVQDLLRTGGDFMNVSPKTQRAWKHTATKRIAQLNNQKP